MRFHYAVKPGVGFIASGIYERGHMHVAVHNKTGSCVYKFFPFVDAREHAAVLMPCLCVDFNNHAGIGHAADKIVEQCLIPRLVLDAGLKIACISADLVKMAYDVKASCLNHPA